MSPDAPILGFMVPVLVLDGSLAGQTVQVDNETHHYLAPGEYYQRFSTGIGGELKSFFEVVRVGYRAAAERS